MRIIKISQETIDDPFGEPKAPSGGTHTAEILGRMNSIFKKRITSSYIANGAVAWFIFEDGNEYEVTVCPSRYGYNTNLRFREDWWKKRDEIEKNVQDQVERGEITQEQADARINELKG